MNQPKLTRDLQKAGASKRQARDLSEVAGKINDVDIPHLSSDAKARIANDIGFGYNPYRRAMGYAWKGAAAFAVLMIIVLAQPAKPGSALYSVKRGTDKVKSFVQEAIPFIGDDKNDDDNKQPSQKSDEDSKSGEHSDSINEGSSNSEDRSGSSDDSSSSGTNSGSGSSSESGSGRTSGSSGGSGSSSDGSGGGHSGSDDDPTP